jgi:hypothetical protein
MGLFDRFRSGDGSASEPPGPPELPRFDYELRYVRGSEAVEKALRLRAEWADTATPVIVGTQQNFSHLTNLWDEEEFAAVSPQDYLEAARKVDPAKWFAEHRPEAPDDPEYLEQTIKPSDWNTESGSGEEFSVVREVLSKRFYPWVLVAKVPTTQAYEVPAYLKFGGWNECPEAAVHVAVWKRWQEKYDAKILCVSGDIIEATVARPPLEKEACYELAREQYAYCVDIVDQGVGSIDALAAVLYGGKSWYFWWD